MDLRGTGYQPDTEADYDYADPAGKID